MTLPATLLVPKFLRFERNELQSLYHSLRDPLVTHVYGLLLLHTDFKTGEFLGGYHRLMELCTPPQPERATRGADVMVSQRAPSTDILMKQLGSSSRTTRATQSWRADARAFCGILIVGECYPILRPARLRITCMRPAPGPVARRRPKLARMTVRGRAGRSPRSRNRQISDGQH